MRKTAKYLLIAFVFMSCDSAIEPPASSNEYFPLTVGSSWVYTGSITATSPSDQMYSFVCIDTLYFEKKVKVLVDRSTYYGYRYYKSSDTTFLQWGVTTSGTAIYLPLLVPEINTTWIAEVKGDFGYIQKITSTVQSTNDTLTISGNKFFDVMKVTIESIASGLLGIDTVVGAHYFSKGVGLIKAENSPYYNNIQIVDYSVR